MDIKVVVPSCGFPFLKASIEVGGDTHFAYRYSRGGEWNFTDRHGRSVPAFEIDAPSLSQAERELDVYSR